jgi:hypothetical protein
MSKKRGNKTAVRPTAAIQFRAETDGVSSLVPVDVHSLIFSVKCTQCGCIRDTVRIEDEEQEVEGSRGTASFIMNCRDCKRQCKVTYCSIELETSGDYSEWKPIITVDCRGCEIVSVACDNWTITSESNNTYDWDAADDFFEYDAELEKPVTVSKVQFRVVGT